MTTNLDFRPKRMNIQAYAGDDLTFDVPVTDAAGNPIDLTGATVTAQVRATASAPDPAIDFTSTVDGPGGVITLSLTAALTATLPPSGVWDCEVSLLGPPVKVMTVAAGTITTTPDVSH